MSDTVEVHTEQHTLSPDKDSISFIAYVDGEKVDCVITGAALKSYFQSDQKPILEVFTENQKTIGSMAEFLITTRPQLMDGALVIRAEDLQGYPGSG